MSLRSLKFLPIGSNNHEAAHRVASIQGLPGYLASNGQNPEEGPMQSTPPLSSSTFLLLVLDNVNIVLGNFFMLVHQPVI